jgi:hypothetical protein
LPRLLPLLRVPPEAVIAVVAVDLAVVMVAVISLRAESARRAGQEIGLLGSPQQESRLPSH